MSQPTKSTIPTLCELWRWCPHKAPVSTHTLYFVFFLELLVVQRLAFDHVDCNAVGVEDNLGLIFIISLVLRLSWKQYRGKVGRDEDAGGRSENLSSSREVCLSNRETETGRDSFSSNQQTIELQRVLAQSAAAIKHKIPSANVWADSRNRKWVKPKKIETFCPKNKFQGSIFNLQKTLVQVVFAIFSKNRETSFCCFYFSLWVRCRNIRNSTKAIKSTKSRSENTKTVS